MDMPTLQSFFMWCTIINFGLLLLSTVMLLAARDLAYRIQSAWIPIPRETWNVVIYAFLGLFKSLWIVFNLVPWVALMVIA